MKSFFRNDKIFLNVMFLTLVVAGGWSIFEKDWLTSFLIIVIAGLLFLPTFIRDNSEIYIPKSFSVALTLFIYATLFLGEIQNFYNKFWWWDLGVHAISALIIGLIGFVILLLMFKKEKLKTSPFMLCVFALSFAVAIGTTWEIFEFLMDKFFGLNMQKSGLMDTMTDLIIDLLGALVAAIIGYFYLVYKKMFPLVGNIISETVRRNV
jgi:uncharacterized membrane protein YjdF